MGDDIYPASAVVVTGLVLFTNLMYCIVGCRRIRLLEARMRSLEEKQETLQVTTAPQQTNYTNPTYYPPIYTYAQQPQPTAPAYTYYQDPQRM
jgi:hypothetical protein